MDDTCLFDAADVDYAKGRYIVLGEKRKPILQGDDMKAVVEEAWAMGITHPAVVDLNITLGITYVF